MFIRDDLIEADIENRDMNIKNDIVDKVLQILNANLENTEIAQE